MRPDIYLAAIDFSLKQSKRDQADEACQCLYAAMLHGLTPHFKPFTAATFYYYNWLTKQEAIING